jgi:hypothetical protein
MENFKMTNNELLVKFEKELKTGFPVVFDVQPNTNGKESHGLYVAQFVPVENPLVATLQGWSPIITRAVMDVKNKELETNTFVQELCTIGNVLEGYSIQYNDTVEKPYETMQPRLTRTEEGFNAYLNENDKFIYRQFSLVGGVAKNVHIEPVAQVEYELDAIKNANLVLEKA